MAKKESGQKEGRPITLPRMSWIDKKIISILAVIYLLGVLVVLTVPRFGPVMIPAETFWLFGLSLQAILLLFGTGSVILYHWFRNPYSPLKVWSISFFIYSLTFFGLLFSSLNIVNENLPVVFFLFRSSMIIWAAGMIYGLAEHLGFEKRLKYLISSLVIVVGYAWFMWGLLMVGDIEYTMYGFLYFIFIPICVYLAWAFYRAAGVTGFNSFSYISLGMAGLAITHAAWSPWHLNYIHAVWFFMSNLSLVPIFAGFAGLFQESRYLKLVRMRI